MKLESTILKRPVKTKVAGGWDYTFEVIGTYNLHFRQLNANEITENLKLKLEANYKAYYFGGLLDVNEEDILILDGKEYKVVSAESPHNLLTHTEILLNV